MKKADINIGSVYVAKVSGNLVRLRLDAVDGRGGYYAWNLATNRMIHLRSALRLRKESVTSPTFGIDMRSEKAKPVIEPEPETDMDFQFDDEGGLL